MTRDEYIEHPKLCKYCNTALAYNRKRYTFCNNSCAASFNNKGVSRHVSKKPLCYCLSCGKLVNKGALKYCSLKCQGIHQSHNRISEWLRTGYTKHKELPAYIRVYLISKSDDKCSRCTWREINPVSGYSPLTIHHIDGNCHNNDINNLVVLCPNCHSITPNYCALNKGNSKRVHRKIR